MDERIEGRILEKLDRMHGDIGKIEQHLVTLNGSVGKHEARLCVIESWRESIEKWRGSHEANERKTVEGVVDLKVEVAKLAGLGGGIGLVVSIVGLIAKALGII